MIKTVRAGRHRFTPPSFGLYWKKSVIRRKVVFHANCRYAVDAERDVSKLFGIGYLPGHHTDSARFGWRYSPSNDKIEILAYVYIKGIRHIEHICFVDLEKEYEMLLMNGGYTYQFICDSYGFHLKHAHDKRLGYALGCFFGGNLPAPHKMSITIT